MKNIVLMILLLLVSCGNNDSINISEQKDEKIIEVSKIIKEEIIIKEIEDKIVDSSNIIIDKKVQKEKIKWKEKYDYRMTCKGTDYKKLNIGEGIEKKFTNLKEVKLLQKKIEEYNEKDYSNGFSYFIGEFCKTKDSQKYVFRTTAKPIYVFGRYDKKKNIVEPAIFKYKTFNYIGGYSEFSGFGKRIGNKIKINNFNRKIDSTYRTLENFLKEKNSKYCYNGLTLSGKKSVCFADVYYSYDFVKNILQEDKICTYYIDDNGKRQVLESCKEFSYK